MRLSRRLLPAIAVLVAVFAAGVRDVAACGGLVAPNGAVRLERASTLVAWHDGVEHYQTSFAFNGDVPALGWLVPLPAVPDRVEPGGRWTLQRLAREVEPPRELTAEGTTVRAAAADVAVLQHRVIDALDVSVLRGSGQGVLDWARGQGFLVGDETRSHILAYASASPVFLAARYDLRAARLRGIFAGDGTPVLVTMHTARPWVPLEVLANADDPIAADLYLLTDTPPGLVPGGLAGVDVLAPGTEVAPGLTVVRQAPMGSQLATDLRSDRNMGWVPPVAWLTALRVETRGSVLTYDMTVVDGAMLTAPPGTPTALVAALGPEPAATRLAALLGGGILLATLLGGVVLVTAVRTPQRSRDRCPTGGGAAAD